MKCTACGTDIPEDSIFCISCGMMFNAQSTKTGSYTDLPLGGIFACPKCGEKYMRTDRWCRGCGTDLAWAKKALADAANKEIHCQKCQQGNPEEARYCRKCGAQMSSEDENERPPEPEKNNVIREREILREREIVMVRCAYCGTLNPQGVPKCKSCGATM